MKIARIIYACILHIWWPFPFSVLCVCIAVLSPAHANRGTTPNDFKLGNSIGPFSEWQRGKHGCGRVKLWPGKLRRGLQVFFFPAFLTGHRIVPFGSNDFSDFLIFGSKNFAPFASKDYAPKILLHFVPRIFSIWGAFGSKGFAPFRSKDFAPFGSKDFAPFGSKDFLRY